MISYSELRRGMAIELDGEPYIVLDWKHVVMQQRTPTLNLKVRHLVTGRVYERSLPGNQRLTLADVDRRRAQYLYSDGEAYLFMDLETYDQYSLTAEQVGESAGYLKEGLELDLVFYKGQPVALELPITVDLTVVDTPPGFKGDTAQSGRKPATLETGLVVKVPMHVNPGQVVRVDTRTGEYVETVE